MSRRSFDAGMPTGRGQPHLTMVAVSLLMADRLKQTIES
jgi:hypothetical protein